MTIDLDALTALYEDLHRHPDSAPRSAGRRGSSRIASAPSGTT
ncbi:hypothetical protein [Nocardioides convexus]|nr:hypothetical protein [Nocardioides convexus]